MEPPGRKYFIGEVIFTDWFPRGGDGMILRVEVIDRSGGTVTVDVYTKNSEDVGDGTSAGTGWTLSTTTSPEFKELIKISDSGSSPSAGLKQLIRLKITVTGTGNEWVLLRVFPVIFFDAAA